ncbi:hypothetical protein EVAR_77950_1 [Eumeta japonica]|uniref:Uncharacterized protein n=1 Tax=Eumeta variegata TaxID=151549 RepID=A0A4C1XTL2_EUMVA|nr:hypothetical protein EVAR_77950_1 [Eumeta japonica]
MEGAGEDMRECLVRLWRCNRAQPRPRVPPSAAYHTLECDEIALTLIKAEYDAEDAFTTEGLLTAVSQQREDSVPDTSLLVKQECEKVPLTVVKTEHDSEDTFTTQGLLVTASQHRKDPGADAGLLVKQEHEKMPLMIIKSEYDVEHTVTTQGLLAAVSKRQEEPVADTGLLVIQNDDFTMKIEDEAEEVMIKQELNVGPTVLQQKTAIWPLAPSDQTDPVPCTITRPGEDVTAAPLCAGEL